MSRGGRIYPAEINPLIELNPETKLCPPETWSPDRPLLQSSDGALSSETQRDIRAVRAAEPLDALRKRSPLPSPPREATP